MQCPFLKNIYFFNNSFILGIVYIFNVNMGIKAVSALSFSLKGMALVFPPIFVLLGFLDVWISRENL